MPAPPPRPAVSYNWADLMQPDLSSLLTSMFSGLGGLSLPNLSNLLPTYLGEAWQQWQSNSLWQDLSGLLNGTNSPFSFMPDADFLEQLVGSNNETESEIRELWADLEELESKHCEPAAYDPPTWQPTQCWGSNTTLIMSGGFCVFLRDSSIVCRKPSVRLAKSAAQCLLVHQKAARVRSKECKLEKQWGHAKEGVLVPPMGHVTVPLPDHFSQDSLATQIAQALAGIEAELPHIPGSGLWHNLSDAWGSLSDLLSGAGASLSSIASWLGSQFALRFGA